MNKLNEYQPTVNRLISQYQEYLALSNKVALLENEKLSSASNYAQSHGISIVEALKQSSTNAELIKIDAKIKLANIDLQRLSDEMSFANHAIWLMYKHQAYKGAKNEIATLGALHSHCSPKDYICTKRFQFLKSYLLESCGVDINNLAEFPDAMLLEEFISHESIVTLLEDVKFNQIWKSYEYYIAQSEIAKWKNFVSEQGLAK